MGKEVNKYGLTRRPPRHIRRKVRQRCGFGCVRCGFAIYDYHHFDPPFEEAEKHDPNGIALLCGNCHILATRGRLSNDTVKEHNRNPKCLEKGFSFGPFDVGSQPPVVILGASTFIETSTILEAFGKPLLKIEPPETARAPFRLSGIFHDKSGNEIFRIIRNEWQGPVTNWDMEIIGPKIIVRRAHRQIALEIRTVPPSILAIERIEMFYKGAQIVSKEGGETTVIAPDGSTIQLSHTATIIGRRAGIIIQEHGVSFG